MVRRRNRFRRFTVLFVLAMGAPAASACGTSSSMGPGDGGNATEQDGKTPKGDTSVTPDGALRKDVETGSDGNETGSATDATRVNDAHSPNDAEGVPDGEAGTASDTGKDAGACVLSDGGVGSCEVWHCCTYQNLLGSHVECIAPTAFDGGCPPAPP